MRIVRCKGKLEASVLRSRAKNLIAQYNNGLEEDFFDECCQFQAHMQVQLRYWRYFTYWYFKLSKKPISSGRIPQYRNSLTNRPFYSSYKYCSGKRSFSCLKRVKNYLRSTLKDEKLNSLAVLLNPKLLPSQLTALSQRTLPEIRLGEKCFKLRKYLGIDYFFIKVFYLNITKTLKSYCT